MVHYRSFMPFFLYIVFLLLSACTTSDHSMVSSVDDETRLFELKQPMNLQQLSSQASSDVDEHFLKVLHDAVAIEDARFIDINPPLVNAKTSRLSVPLPNGQTIKFQRRHVHEEGGDVAYWYGDIVSDRKQRYPSPSEIEADPVSRMVLVRQGQRLSGEIHLPGQHYRLENAGAGRHVLIKLGIENNLKCEPIYEARGTDLEQAVSGRQPKSRSTIRVMFVSTTGARELDPGFGNKISPWLNMASRDFSESGVDVEFKSAGYYTLDLKDSDFDYDSNKILREIETPDTDAGKKVAAQRDSWEADLVIIAVGNPWTALKSYIGAKKETAFAVITPLHDPEILTHQLGHLFGAMHIWKPGDPDLGGPAYRFAHKLFVGSTKYHTIMGRFDCENNTCDQYEINRFSDPNATFASVPLGTKEHNDNVRYLNEVRDAVSKFYP